MAHHEVGAAEGLYNLTDRGFGLATVTHLGEQVGSGQVRLVDVRVAAVVVLSGSHCLVRVCVFMADALTDGDYVPYDKVGVCSCGRRCHVKHVFLLLLSLPLSLFSLA